MNILLEYYYLKEAGNKLTSASKKAAIGAAIAVPSYLTGRAVQKASSDRRARVEECERKGFKKGTPEFKRCIDKTIERDEKRELNNITNNPRNRRRI